MNKAIDMETGSNEEDDITTLYEAATRGCVSTLNTLIQKDPLLLHKTSLSTFSETPLHISSLLGHLHFSLSLLSKHPTMAGELDSRHRSPLHLAAAEGHVEVAKGLLEANSEVCVKGDEDDRIPLHLAAMRGRVEVVKELILARPDSIYVCSGGGDSVFHLCVKFNRLEVLKVLVKLVHDNNELLLRGDRDGNTILHLAVMLKQAKTVGFLLTIPQLKESSNAPNLMNLTAIDTLHLSPPDFKTFQIRCFFMDSGAAMSSSSSNLDLLFNRRLPPGQAAGRTTHSPYPLIAQCNKFLEYQGNTIEGAHGSLMIVATVIATMSFQAAINPPDRVSTDNTGGLFFFYNTIAFMSSLSVILLIISGFPLPNRLGMWLLTLAISMAVGFTALTYLHAVYLSHARDAREFRLEMVGVTFYLWLAFVGLVLLPIVIRFLVWIWDLLRKCWEKMSLKFRGEDRIFLPPHQNHVINVQVDEIM